MYNRSCTKCRFVVAKENYSSSEKLWECRYAPPSVAMDDGVTYAEFPEVDEYDWCFKFEKKEFGK